MITKPERIMKSFRTILFFGVLIAFLAGCAGKAITYNERNFDRLGAQTGVTVKMIDGKTFHFYKAEVIRYTNEEIWLKTLEKKNSAPVEYAFRRSEIVIENRQNSQSGTVNYLLTMALLISIIALLNRWLY